MSESSAVEAALAAFWRRYCAEMPPEAEGYLDDEKADLLATVTALVAAERERILGLMAHGSPCQQNDATCPHDPDGSWADCLTDAIRQAPRP